MCIATREHYLIFDLCQNGTSYNPRVIRNFLLLILYLSSPKFSIASSFITTAKILIFFDCRESVNVMFFFFFSNNWRRYYCNMNTIQLRGKIYQNLPEKYRANFYLYRSETVFYLPIAYNYMCRTIYTKIRTLI